MVSPTRKGLESLYKGKCTVFEYQSVQDPDTKITTQQEVDVLTDQPCRLSYKTVASTSNSDGAAAITQTVTLFIAPEIIIKPGSKITIIQNDVTADYQSSGKPAVYTNHQEISIELFQGWA
ncbi:hypothetical protein [Anaerospora hongkongensis]|uniref:hypothetical protein n=1 Tax=Anaerospora hongkongensis TaxID=244830 RepID=UPI002896F2D2|nr:hypothetical protein [Anaerospora hongkongensis]